jgi:hypothetical protein
MLAAGGLLYAGETYLAAERFSREQEFFGAVGALIGASHWLLEILRIFAGFAVAVLAVPAFLGLNWARAVSWVFGLPMLIWYGVAAFFGGLGTLMGGSDGGGRVWPPWLDTLDTALTVAAAALLIGALVGQTVPAADDYFRRRLGEKVR